MADWTQTVTQSETSSLPPLITHPSRSRIYDFAGFHKAEGFSSAGSLFGTGSPERGASTTYDDSYPDKDQFIFLKFWVCDITE